MARFKRVKPGDPIAADDYNAIAERLERFANLSVAHDGPLRLWSGPSGKALALALPRETTARLSGNASPYSWTEVFDAASGAYEGHPSANSDDANAYEVNGVTGLDGQVVQLSWSSARDWRFQWVGFGSPAPCDGGRICVTVEADGCSPELPVLGATVTVTDSADPPNTVGTGITTGHLTGFTLTDPGSGYTDGTGYALEINGDGSGASGTFDVVAGQVTNLTLTDEGSNYTSATIHFPSAGPGTNAAATATIKGRCCIAIPSAGIYGIRVHVPGAIDRLTTVNAACSQDNAISITFPSNSLGTVCFSFRRCTSLGDVPVSNATVSVTGTGITSGTGNTAGILCLSLGIGSYSVTVTYPSGVTRTLDFSVFACSTTSINVMTITSVCFTARTNAPGCTATISVYNEEEGTLLGSGSLTTAFDGFFYSGTTYITVPESFIGSFSFFGYDIAWPQDSFHSTATVSCYTSTAPIIADPPGVACQ